MDKISVKWPLRGITISSIIVSMAASHQLAFAASFINEPVHACVLARDVDLTAAVRAQFAECLGWQADPNASLCLGSYKPISVTPLSSENEVRIMADKMILNQQKPSTLSGNVEIQESQRVVNAQTAHIYRDAKTNQITKIEFLGNVHYLEPNKLMIARKATINPQDKSGLTEDVIYRINTDNKHHALLPAWGRASLIQRFANADLLFKRAIYTTCAPQDKAWHLEAKSIHIDDKKSEGVARHVTVKLREWPVLYTPYLTFPTTNERKSGLLMPILGYSNTGGFNLGLPYYWNIAPNYDLTLIPHGYSERGVMLGADFRFLTENSMGLISGNFLPDDAYYRNFLNNHETQFPRLQGSSTNRWSLGIIENTQFTPNLRFHTTVQQVSDDYYFQDFSTNLALITQRQLLRQADLTYSTEHWVLRGMAQSYQTLHPVNESPIMDQYERLPQIMAHGYYFDLPAHADLNLSGQYDQFFWPSTWWDQREFGMPHGPRLHVNPVLSLPQRKAWGYITPTVDFVENYYDVQHNWGPQHTEYNRFIPRASVHSGLFFDRHASAWGHSYVQTLEPSLYYLYVPYKNQSAIPIYDTANMIFNVDQLFRMNRFSGFDRIGDANQLSYALATRWMSARTGSEFANLSVGQIKYFSNRNVQLCRNMSGYCVANPYEIGQLSPYASTSPIASRASYYINSTWRITGDYVWDPDTSATNNGGLNFHYQSAFNTVVNFGYSYLVNGDVTAVRNNGVADNALHQAIVSFSLPVSDRWTTLGAYSHNLSKDYSMMSLLGVQYDSCCWALRLLGGRTFKNLNTSYQPQYNNNVYLQILLKGLGSVGNSDPNNILNTYIPGYNDPFHR